MCAKVPVKVMMVSLGRDGGKDIHDYLKKYGRDRLKELLDNPLTMVQAAVKWTGEAILANKDKFPPIDFEGVLRPLGLTIKNDNINKVITLFCGLSAYTEEGQFNISYNGPSSTGKTYIPLEICNFFPKEDVMVVGYSSAKAFFHDYSYMRGETVYVVDLSKKIIIFLDQPHTILLEHLRPLLSHDRKEITLKITDKNKGGMRTKTIVVIGYPAVMFCSANLLLDEQEATRFILLSPEISEEKIRAAVHEKITKESNRQAYKDALDSNPERLQLKQRIEAIKEARIGQVKFRDSQKIESLFLNGKGRLKPRHPRDVGRVMNLVAVSALLNLWHREVEGNDIYVNDEDIENGFKLWGEISKSQELNLPQYVYDLYINIVDPLLETNPGGVTKQAVIRSHVVKYDRSLAEWKLRREILPMLEMAGLVVQVPDPNDKRRVMICRPINNLDN